MDAPPSFHRYGSLFARPLRVLFLVIAFELSSIQQRPRPVKPGEGESSGARYAQVTLPLISRDRCISPEFAPLQRAAAGLPGFFGPIPSAILDESGAVAYAVVD
jgi:hypothetical protein